MRNPRATLVLAAFLAMSAAPAQAGITGADLPQDDAGSGRDAPATLTDAVEILPGIVYEGNLTTPLGGPGILGDESDIYAIDALAGRSIEIRAAGTGVACIYLYATDGAEIDFGCPVTYGLEATIVATLTTSGRYHVEYTYFDAQNYRLSFGLDAPAPAVSALSPPSASGTPPQAPAGASGADAVIALIDDGINPYHLAFRDASPRALEHPSTYLAGFPADAEAIHITFDHANLVSAVETDCAEWEKVEVGKLYWFPGTRVVGAITFPTNFTDPDSILPYDHGAITCEDPALKAYGNLVGDGGHGTMTSSRAAAAGYGGCPECLIVMVQGFGSEHVRWAAAQPWIDLQSNSWGPIVPIYGGTDHAGLALASPSLVRAVEESSRAQLSFWAAMNGAAGRYGVLGHPTQAAGHLGPSAIRVGATDSGQVAIWGGSFPHVASDGCNSWAAQFNTLDGASGDVGSGTSAATPFVAGSAARVIREARAALGDASVGERAGGVLAEGAPMGDGPLADGVLTRAELTRVLFHTADARPAATPEDATPCSLTGLYDPLPVAWADVPGEDAAQLPMLGYGAITRVSADTALRVLFGEAAEPARPIEDAYFAHDEAARAGLYEAYAASPV